MIFSRSQQNGNVVASGPGPWSMLAIFALSLHGCAATPSIPSNLILNDAHTIATIVAFDERSQTLASGGSEGGIRLWRLPDGNRLAAWKAHTDSVEGLAFVDNDRTLLSSSYDGTLARWTLAGKLLERITTPSPITSMAVDENHGRVITGHGDGYVRQWRLANLELLSTLPVHRGKIRVVTYHAANGQLASSGTDGQVYLWHDGEQPRRLPTPPTDARGLTFSPDGKWLTGGGWFKLFRWHLADGSLQALNTEHHGIIQSLDYSRDGNTLASISRQLDSAVYFLDAQTGAVTRRFQPHDLCGTYARLSPDERYLATASDDASVRIWDLQHPLPEQSFYSETK